MDVSGRVASGKKTEQLPRVAMLVLKNTAFDSIMLALNSPELKFLCDIRVKVFRLPWPANILYGLV